jgi:hypothetical protein
MNITEKKLLTMLNVVFKIRPSSAANQPRSQTMKVRLTKEQRKMGPRKKVRKSFAAARAREVFEVFRDQL